MDSSTGQPADEGIERALSGIETALGMALESGSPNAQKRQALRDMESAVAEIARLREGPVESGVHLAGWVETLAALIAADTGISIGLTRELALRMADDPARSLTSQTLHGGIALRSLIRD